MRTHPTITIPGIWIRRWAEASFRVIASRAYVDGTRYVLSLIIIRKNDYCVVLKYTGKSWGKNVIDFSFIYVFFSV